MSYPLSVGDARYYITGQAERQEKWMARRFSLYTYANGRGLTAEGIMYIMRVEQMFCSGHCHPASGERIL